MAAISKKEYSRYFFIIFFLILLVLAFLLLKPFITPLLLSIILAYAFYPLYNKLNLIIKNKSLCSLLMVIFILIIITVPLSIIIKSLISEGASFYNYASGLTHNLSPQMKEITQKAISTFTSEITPSLNSLKNFISTALIFLFSLFYFFKDGEKIIKLMTKKIPLKKSQKAQFSNEFKQVTAAVIYGFFFVGLIQGILGAFGFYLFGISSPILWGMIIMILSILPVVGPPFVWIPAAIIKFLNHEYFIGILLALFGVLVLGSIDTFLKPKLIGKRAKIHPLIIVIGVFGGLKILGITGIIFGPLILVILMTVINFILKEKQGRIRGRIRK